MFKNKSAEIFDQKSELSILRSSLVLKIHRSHLPVDSFAHFYLETRKREEEHRTFSSVFFSNELTIFFKFCSQFQFAYLFDEFIFLFSCPPPFFFFRDTISTVLPVVGVVKVVLAAAAKTSTSIKCRWAHLNNDFKSFFFYFPFPSHSDQRARYPWRFPLWTYYYFFLSFLFIFYYCNGIN